MEKLTDRLFVEWFVDGERSSMRRGEESLPLNIRVRKMVTFSLNGTSQFRATRDLSHGDWCNRLSADILSVSVSHMVNAEFDLHVHSHLHLESLTRTILYIVPPYNLFSAS